MDMFRLTTLSTDSLETISDIAPVEVVFNEGRFGYLDYSHHVSFTELTIISPR